MEVNLPLIGFTILALVLLLVFIISKNRKDRKKLEEDLNNDYKKSRENEGDIDIEGNDSL
jgi:hypothetical protein